MNGSALTIFLFLTNCPPSTLPLEFTHEMITTYGAAMYALGQLNEATQSFQNKNLLTPFIIKEALFSSAIEGIHTTALDVFAQPLLHSKPDKDTQLVINYATALNRALDMIGNENLPLSNRVICNTHKILFEECGNYADPGNFRSLSVRVGNLIPAPSQKISDLMSDLEIYINTDNSLPPLIKAGLVHLQFETIHPFLDGNGRIGRLIIPLMLIESGLLQMPVLYLSHYFKRHQLEYYYRLDNVRTKGDVEGWLLFFLKGIEESCIDAYHRTKDLITLKHAVSSTIRTSNLSNKSQELMQQAADLFFDYPIIRTTDLAEKLGKSYNTTDNLVETLVGLNILSEITGQKRNKLYQFTPYLELLDKEYPE